MIKEIKKGKNCKIYPFINLYRCELGDDVLIANFVEVQSHVKIGDRSRISTHTFICSGVEIESDCFIGHHVCFTNDRYPIANNPDYKMEKTIVRHHASIGSGAVLLPGITIGEHALVGAGAVVTKDVPPYATVVGNPARIIRRGD